jgi:choline dehydrogenase
MQDIWPKTVLNAGYKEAKDPRSGSAIGGFNQLNTIDPQHNRRSYAARGYYEPHADRPNLSLQLNALVSKIELENSDGNVKATGVQFIVDGTVHAVRVKREVIVCGGVINSPQILELSGIGSPIVLQEAGVDVIVELPGVGENLNDHTATGIALVSHHEVTFNGEAKLIRARLTKSLQLKHSCAIPRSCSKHWISTFNTGQALS